MGTMLETIVGVMNGVSV
ncbi:Protein of unknown function [Bacillus cereus]|nr:Protein of unknown function [Bacillus cereus]